MLTASLPKNTLNSFSYTRGFYTDQMLFHDWGCAILMSWKLGRVHKTGKSKRSVGSTARSAQFFAVPCGCYFKQFIRVLSKSSWPTGFCT